MIYKNNYIFGLLILTLILLICLYLYSASQKPFIFNFHKYPEKTSVYDKVYEKTGDVVLDAVRVRHHIKNLNDVEKYYTEHDVGVIKSKLYHDGKSVLWDPSIKDNNFYKNLEKILILLRFEYVSFNDEHFTFYITKDIENDLIYLSFVVFEKGYWKLGLDNRNNRWGKDITGIRKAFHSSKEKNSLITEEKLETLVRGVLEELKQEQVTGLNKGK